MSNLPALLASGYFPTELPEVFSTKSFGLHVLGILSDWEKDNVFIVKQSDKIKLSSGLKIKKRGSYTYQLPHAEIEIISKPKRGYERRNVNITHPISQALLSLEITKNWKSIQKWLVRQTYSLDEIRISENYARSIKGINFEIHRAKKAYIESIADWLVKTDITRFYPTIYTHSIAWAAYGKETVKSNLKLYEGSLADRLDLLVRCCNRNQTIGIPIGPETSRIIAEVISSRIDADFQKVASEAALPLKPELVDRLQDDWFVGANAFESAERILSTITAVYREYGLDINGSKTSVDRINTSSEKVWVSEIGAFLSHCRSSIHGHRLRELLALSLRLQADHLHDPVINYTLSVIENQHFSLANDIEMLESFLLKAAVISPISMDRICRIILNLQHNTKKVSRSRIASRFTVLAEQNLEKGHLFEVIWLLYTLRGLKVPLRSKFFAERVQKLSSSVLPLILLDMKSKGLCSFNLPIDAWSNTLTAERVRTDWTWLLAYEGIRLGWLRDPHQLMNEPFFKAMRSRNVEFYDPTRNVPHSKNVMGRKWTQKKKNLIDTKKLLLNLRGFDDVY